MPTRKVTLSHATATTQRIKIANIPNLKSIKLVQVQGGLFLIKAITPQSIIRGKGNSLLAAATQFNKHLSQTMYF